MILDLLEELYNWVADKFKSDPEFKSKAKEIGKQMAVVAHGKGKEVLRKRKEKKQREQGVEGVPASDEFAQYNRRNINEQYEETEEE